MPDAPRFRFARSDELPEISRLVTHSFPGASRTAAYWEEQLQDLVARDGLENILVAEQGQRIVASLLIHSFRQWIAGQPLPMAGIGLVTVAPTHRKRRLAGDLVTEALRIARRRGDVVSGLYPFRVSFYQKLGFGQASEALQYQISPRDLADFPERERVELVDTDPARGEALALYHAWAATQTGQLERYLPSWTKILSVTDRAMFGYRAPSGDLQGYAIVNYRVDLPPRQRFLEVDELIYTTIEARRGLYGWLASLGDQWDQLLLRALPAERLGDWIREPRLPYGSVPPWGLAPGGAALMMGAMFRLLDVEKCWSSRAIAPTTPLSILFDVTDEQIEENTGRWRVSLGLADRPTGTPLTASVDRSTTADATIRLNVSTLSRLYIGALKPADALTAGLLSCDKPEMLEPLGAALALPEPWTFDRY